MLYVCYNKAYGTKIRKAEVMKNASEYFHINKYHGSHVIVMSDKLTNDLIQKAGKFMQFVIPQFKKFDGGSAARGRIYDRNGKIIVDNKAVKTIYYKKIVGVSASEEVVMAYKMASILDLDFKKLNDYDLRNFWVINNPRSAKQKITEEEWKKFKERKISSEEIERMKLDRVKKEELDEYEDLDKKLRNLGANIFIE